MAQTITLCVLTNNSAETITETLESVRQIINELVIVDLGSSDNTKKIAKKFGETAKIKTKLIDFKLNADYPDYSSARNEGIKNASSDWIFMLNPGELVSQKDQNLIRSVISSGYGDAVPMTLRTYSNLIGVDFNPIREEIDGMSSPIKEKAKSFAGFSSFNLIRFFRNEGYSFKYPINETIAESIAEKGGVIAEPETKIVIHSFNHENSIESFKSKKIKEIDMLKKSLNNFPNSSKVFFELGKAYQDIGEDNSALDCYEKIINAEISAESKKNEKAESAVFGRQNFLYYRAGLIYLKKNDIEKAKKAFYKSIDAMPFLRIPYILLAKLLINSEHPQEALLVLKKALEKKLGDIEMYNLAGFSLIKLGKASDAIAVLEDARKLCEKKADARQSKIKSEKNVFKNSFAVDYGLSELIYNNLYTAYLMAGRGDDAISLLENAVSKNPNIVSFYLNLINLLSKANQDKKALDYCKKVLSFSLKDNIKNNIQSIIAKLEKNQGVNQGV